jgi:hypothetical protein
VLVALGLAIALAGPVWKRIGQGGQRLGRRGQAGGRLVAVSPVLSACFVLLLGLGMLWRTGLGA